ncbi:MAG: DEAD/DEAH box helicase [Planctomycetes bacterium]|nr:DEAD/DEAH box helicase [Planctomycetota bacterium]
MTSFASLHLVEPLLLALHDEGYTSPTPIQTQAIPPLLAGHDLLGCARTGTGKTAAFALPILQRLFSTKHAAPKKSARVLVVVPTRELASQVAESFTTYGRRLHPRVAVIFGGVGQSPQVRAMERGVDVLVATPGRLLDLMQQGFVRLDGVETLVLDEADQMLDLGFLPDVKRILAAVPKRRQTLLFSATMPKPIEELAGRILNQPQKIFVTPTASTVELVQQRVQYLHKDAKPQVLTQMLRDPAVRRVLVFTRTKRGCDKVAKRLNQDGIPAQAIHGNKSQGNREKSLAGFRAGKIRVLVATDIAARGIDVDDITHVVNYEIPNVPETYVHRIGRTARAGAEGMAISLCASDERDFVRDIERLIKRSIQVIGPPPGEQPRATSTAGARNGSRPAGGQPAGNRRGPARPQRQQGGRPQRSTGARPQQGGRPQGGGGRGAGQGQFHTRDSRSAARIEVRPETRNEEKQTTFGVGV